MVQGGPLEPKRAKFDLPTNESGNLSPRIFRKSKPTAGKPKTHRGRPTTGSTPQKTAEEQSSSAKARVGKVAKGFEGYLDLVSYLYYGYLPTSSAAREAEYEQREGKGGYKFTTLDQVLSPMRADLAFEKWCPKEIALFECGICKYGKDFEKIHEIVETKTVPEVIEFFYNWKKTSHYKQWKQKVIEERSRDKYDWVFLN